MLKRSVGGFSFGGPWDMSVVGMFRSLRDIRLRVWCKFLLGANA